MADDSAELIVGESSRRVAMDLLSLSPKSGPTTKIEGEVHDQEDLKGSEATLKIDGVGTFNIKFFTPTRFRGTVILDENNGN